MVHLYFFCLFFLETFLGLPISPHFHMHSVSFWSERHWQLPVYLGPCSSAQPSSHPHSPQGFLEDSVRLCFFLSSFSKRYGSTSMLSLLHPPYLFLALWPIVLTPLSLQRKCSILLKILGVSIRSPHSSHSLLINCVVLGKFLNLFKPWFPYLQVWPKDGTCLRGLLWGFHEDLQIKCFERWSAFGKTPISACSHPRGNALLWEPALLDARFLGLGLQRISNHVA